MRWTVKENEICACPSLTIDDLPDKIPPNIHVLHNNGMLSIASENVAGILPCKNGHEIVIESKYGSISPVDLMLYLGNISGIAINKERITSGKSEVNLQTIADAFVAQLKILGINARKFKRIPVRTTASSVVGKVDWLNTYRAQQSGRQTIYTTQTTVSFDIAENALIAAAAKKVAAYYTPVSEEYRVLLPWITYANENPHSHRELFGMQSRMTEKALSGAHAFYYAPVMLSKMILGFMGADNTAEAIDTILFNMPGLYEEYIRTGLQRVGNKFGSSIQKGFSPRSFLFCNGECELIPDITIYEGTTLKAVLDVKYKTPDSKDYYQIYAYMKYANIDTAYIISPAVPHEKTLISFDGAKIVYIQIANSDYTELEATAEKIIRGVM